MSSKPITRAMCPECYKFVTVKKDGGLRQHTNGRPEWPGSPFSQHCPGSGKAS